MNNVNINNPSFVKTQEYQEFVKNNPSRGYLNIRIFTADEAVPINNLKVVVSKVIDNNNVIFFEGNSNSSGIVPVIILPTPKLNQDDLEVPNGITYDILIPDDNKKFQVEMFENVNVIQNINISRRDINGN